MAVAAAQLLSLAPSSFIQTGDVSFLGSQRASRAHLRAPVLRHQQQGKGLQCNALFGGNKKEGGGGPGGFMNMMEGLKKAQEVLQKEAAVIQKEMAESQYDGYSDDELVKVTLSGNQEPISAEITEAAVELGADRLSELVTQAYKEAFKKSQAAAQGRMKEMAGRLGVPPNFGA